MIWCLLNIFENEKERERNEIEARNCEKGFSMSNMQNYDSIIMSFNI